MSGEVIWEARPSSWGVSTRTSGCSLDVHALLARGTGHTEAQIRVGSTELHREEAGVEPAGKSAGCPQGSADWSVSGLSILLAPPFRVVTCCHTDKRHHSGSAERAGHGRKA